MTLKEKVVSVFTSNDDTAKAKVIKTCFNGNIRLGKQSVIFSHQSLFEFLNRHVKLEMAEYDELCQIADTL